METKTSEVVTWEMLCKLEPKLLSLLNEIRRTREKGINWFRIDNLWYDRFKPVMCDLVGFGAEGEGIIASSRAYNIAYDKLYNALHGR